MFSNAYANLDVNALDSKGRVDYLEDLAILEKEKELLDTEKDYNASFHLNASLSYKFKLGDKSDLFITLYSENIHGSSKRYYVSTGSGSRPYPSRLRYTEEPRTIGFRAQLKFK